MKKIITLITLSKMIVAMTTPVLSWDFVSGEAAANHFAAVNRRLQVAHENFEKGKTDDTALKEGISSIFMMILALPNENPFAYTQELMLKNEIPHERQIKILEEMIHEILSILKKGENLKDPPVVVDYIDMLGTFPDYDLLPLLKECLNSTNGEIRNRAQKRYNALMEKT